MIELLISHKNEYLNLHEDNFVSSMLLERDDLVKHPTLIYIRPLHIYLLRTL